MSDDENNVISLIRRPPMKKPVELDRSKPTDCKHLEVLVHDRLPKVYCKQCREVVDPVWYLRLLAHKLVLMDYRINELRKLEARAADRREKARLRRAKKKSPPV